MDDYSLSSLTESKNELCARLVNVLTPLIISGFKDIFTLLGFFYAVGHI